MIYKLYDGKILLEFDPIKHKYTIDGKGIDGVSTTIKILSMSKVDDWAVSMDMLALKEMILSRDKLSAAILDDMIKAASRFHASERDGKADQGTNVHACIESFIKTGEAFPEPVTAEEAHRVMRFIDWAKENVSEFVDSERPVYSKKYKYCGTLDFTCFLKGHTGLFVGDIKNAKYIYPKNFLQTAAYQQALNEETGKNIEGRVIVRLGPDVIEIAERLDFKEDFAAFKAALKLSRWFGKASKKPRN